MQRHFLLTLAFAAFPAVALSGQSAGDVIAATALSASHIGALTPLLTPAMVGRQLNGAQLGIRYGLLDNAARQHAIAGSAILGAGTNSSVTLTAGVTDRDCASCSPAMMLGVGADMRVFESGDVVGAGSSFNVGVSGDLGYAQIKPGDDHGIALGIGVPVSLTVGSRNTTGMRIVPYFTPVFGIGNISQDCPVLFPDCESNGTSFVIGGGVGFWNPMTSVGVSLGINQVMIAGSEPVFGLSVVFGGR